MMGFTQGGTPPSGSEERENPSIYFKVFPIFGTPIEKACEDAAALSKRIGCGVYFAFNGIPVYLWPDSDPARAAEGWKRNLGCQEGKGS